MVDVMFVLELIDWNRDIEEQKMGIEIASQIKDIGDFIQPCNAKYNKSVWENCSKIISSRADSELSAHLCKLFEWLQDLNWPGAICIFDRLCVYNESDSYNEAFNSSMKKAHSLKDELWINNLYELKKERGTK